MKVITDCQVEVVGVPHFLDHPIYKIPPDGTDAERLGAFAAKGCYDAYGTRLSLRTFQFFCIR